MTASISAAVVPGAKLLARTVVGPPFATPLMLKPGASAFLSRVDWNLLNARVLRSTCDAEAVRLIGCFFGGP